MLEVIYQIATITTAFVTVIIAVIALIVSIKTANRADIGFKSKNYVHI